MNDEDFYYIPELPDLKALNLSFVEWLEEIIERNIDGCYMYHEHSFEEEEEHWTAIARSLNEQQLEEIEKRIQGLRAIARYMAAFHEKAKPTYYTRQEQSAYVERRVREGCGRWQAKREAREGKLVPSRNGDSASALPESPTAPPK